VVVDFPQLDFKVAANRSLRGIGVVSALRWGLFTPGTSRLVFDVSGPVGVGRIDRDQVADYANRKGEPIEVVERWLRPNLGY
jgi:hypothetical protein